MVLRNTRVAFTLPPEHIAAMERSNGYPFHDATDLRIHVLRIIRDALEERYPDLRQPAPDREGSDGR